MRKSYFFTFAIILFSLLAAIYFYPLMPSKMATHWDYLGQADGFSTRAFGMFFMPILLLIMLQLFVFLPQIDPLKHNIKKFEKYFNWFIVSIVGFMTYLQILVIAWNLGLHFNFVIYILPAFAGLFYGAGILMENTKRNYFIGFRTPWALHDDAIWEKTNKMGGRLFKVAALIGILGLWFQTYAFLFMIGPIMAFSVFVFVWSWWEWKRTGRLGKLG